MGLCEWCCGMHKNPVNITFHLIAAVLFVYSLWINSWKGILLAIIIALIGHLLQAISGKKVAKRRR